MGNERFRGGAINSQRHNGIRTDTTSELERRVGVGEWNDIVGELSWSWRKGMNIQLELSKD